MRLVYTHSDIVHLGEKSVIAPIYVDSDTNGMSVAKVDNGYFSIDPQNNCTKLLVDVSDGRFHYPKES